jgi:hypothetical protein
MDQNPLPLSGTERLARSYLTALVLPAWTAAGAIDYWLHRNGRIEATSGVFESTLHITGISMAGIPVVAGLFFEVNAGVLLLCSASFLTHIGMTVWDIDYASTRRPIGQLEQHVHGMLELLPFTALSLLICSHPAQALALAGRGPEKPRFAFTRKRVPLPRAAVAGNIVAVTAFVLLPFVEEFVRCVRYARRSE